jgi:dihydropteroate synthase
MFDVAAALDSLIVLTHSRDTPNNMNHKNNYKSLVDDTCFELQERIAEALSKGIYRWNIMVDPGLGFSKLKDQNLEMIQSLDKFNSFMKYPSMVSFSEKKFVSNFLIPFNR